MRLPGGRIPAGGRGGGSGHLWSHTITILCRTEVNIQLFVKKLPKVKKHGGSGGGFGHLWYLTIQRSISELNIQNVKSQETSMMLDQHRQ